MERLRLPLSIACAAAAISAFGASERLKLRIDDDWKFQRDPLNFAGSVTTWKSKVADVKTLEIDALPSDLESGTWRTVRTGRDVFRGRIGFAWFETDLGHDPKNQGKLLHFEGVDDNGAVYLNGRLLKRHRGWNDPFDVSLEDAWNPSGPNDLVVLVENTAGGGGITAPVTFEKPSAGGMPDGARNRYDDSSWRTVHVPHDYVVEGVFDQQADTGHGSLPVAPAWYRKHLTVPDSFKGKSVWIDFDGVYRDSTVWLNGHMLGRHPGGYTGFRFDIAPFLRYGKANVLAVRVDPRRTEGWWYEGGGIYRHVWLTITNPLHIDEGQTYVRSTVGNGSADVMAEAVVRNEGSALQSCHVLSQVFDAGNRLVAKWESTVPVGPHGSTMAANQLKVSNPQLWSVDEPNLYRLHTTVSAGGRTLDETDNSFGIRTIKFDVDNGFFLNGKPLKLQGTCNHQDHAGVGIAIPDNLFYWRVKKLKEMGSNAYRCSHNEVTSELLDACDTLGMVVMDENRHLGDTESAKTSAGTGYSDLSELKSLILRDRNHPSVVMWSMCNEEPLQGSPEGAKIFQAMQDLTHGLDPTRPVSCAMNGGWGAGISNVEDLQGINYGIYAYDDFHKKFPAKPVYGSETASTVSTRGIYANDRVRGYVSAYDVNAPDWGATAEKAWEPIAKRPWFAGGFVWTGFDYKGEPTPYGWPCINSHFGILDICGFPKDIFYYYQAWWGDKPMVHLLPHWNWKGQEGKPISVWAFSNGDRVELLLNGKSLGARTIPAYEHVEWSVPYEPGTLEARAYKGDKLVASDTVKTAGAPYALVAKSDVTTLPADGEEVSEVQVTVVDAQGNMVPDASDQVSFEVTGAQVVGVGNGDPSSHEPDKAKQRHAFNGLCMALVGAATSPGEVTVKITAPGLKPAVLHLRTVASGGLK